MHTPTPSNVIYYTASEKLAETTSQYGDGVRTNAFGATMLSHTFKDGRGIITFDGDVTKIGKWAFLDCYGLTSIAIPVNVTSIGAYAFYPCYGLTSITCNPVTPPSLGSTAIPENVKKIYVPSASVNAYKTATNWKSYSSKMTAIV